MRVRNNLLAVLAALAFSLYALGEGVSTSWYEAFQAPTTEHKPWNFWYWMYGNVTDEGIIADLNAMHDAGIVGFYLMPIKSVADGKELGGTAEQLSPEWWRRIDTVYRTADSLGLQMGIHFCDGFALGGGPWITPAESMQKVVWTDTIIGATNAGKHSATAGKHGAKRSGASNATIIKLAQPKAYDGYYEDIAVYAYPANYYDPRTPSASVSFPLSSSEPCDIVMTYDEPYTLRSVKIVTGGNNYQAHRFKLYASDNGKDYRFVKEISPARQGWQNTDAYATYSVPATKARYFKFSWTPVGSDPGAEDMDAAKWKPNLKIGGLVLGSEPVIDGYEGKSGAVWRVSPFTGAAEEECVPADKVLDLTAYLSPDGTLTLPASLSQQLGGYHLLRMGHTSTGHTNATGGGGRGLECDKFSRAAIRKQFEGWFEAIYARAPKDVAERVLTRLHVDSWECGCQNWSEGFAAEFSSRRGYDLMPWLPLFAGVPIASAEKSDEVLRDVRLTVAELVNEVFFSEMESEARRYGVKLSCECVAPTMVSDGLLHYQHADYPMGEFWVNSPTHDKPNDMLDAVSGAHIYNKNVIQAESFTEVRGTWDEHPAVLKPLLDRNYCLGINSVVFHVNTLNPWLDRQPGMTLDGIGTFFQRDNTWWREMPAFTAYIARCQALLQYGQPVVDLAVYTGDEVPRRSILPERLITSLPGLYGAEAIEREQQRLANVGQPLEVSPVGVTHTANMTKADAWTNPLRGYRYDSFNLDALVGSHAEAAKGPAFDLDITLATRSGMRYAALVVPQERKMNPDRLISNEAWAAIDRLEQEGVRVIRDVWSDEDLSALGLRRDASLPEGIDYCHRTANDADIYFFANLTNEPIAFRPQLRAQREYAYIANPMTGEISAAGGTTENISAGGTKGNSNADNVSLSLEPSGARFVVLCDAPIDPALLTTPIGQTVAQPLNSKAWTLTFEKNGQRLTTDSLASWTTLSDDPAIKFYSGHVAYETTFTLPRTAKNKGKRSSDSAATKNANDNGKRTLLAIDHVDNLATVYVNGICCGTTWLAPYTVDITDALKAGEEKANGTNANGKTAKSKTAKSQSAKSEVAHDLKIVVVNTWTNALQGNDEGTPPFNGIWTNARYRRASKDLLPAGLIGNVAILKEL